MSLLKLPLSGGTGGRSGQFVYTAPNGVVVTSSAPTYTNNGYYFMEFLFDNINNSSNALTYWLTNSTGNQTLTFDFATYLKNIRRIVVYPRTRSDASSNYRIFVSHDGVNWEQIVGWTTTSTSTPYGTAFTHELDIEHRFVRFELTRNGSWGVTLNEIEFYYNPYKPVESIKLNKNEASVELGRDEQLSVEFTPSDATIKDLLWTSSNRNVVEVSNEGRVVAVGVGEAVVKAESADTGVSDTCLVNVYATTTMGSKATIRRSGQLDRMFKSVIRRNDDSVLSSVVDIVNNEPLMSKVFTSEYNEIDLQYSVPFGADLEQIRSRLQVPFRRDRYSTAIIKPIDLDIYSKYIIPYEESILSILRVTNHSEMDIAYRLIQAPILEHLIPALKDTYTRQSRPTLNHGGRETLVTGISEDGEYITYIEFDLSIVKNVLQGLGMMNRGLELILNFVDNMFGSLSIYECLSNWDEYSITWLTDLAIGDRLLDVEIDSTNVRIDISDIVMRLLEQGKTKLNIVIKSSDFLFIRSRGSSTPPTLKFRYSDPKWTAFSDEYETMSKSLIRKESTNDLISKLGIIEKFIIKSKVIIEKIECDLMSFAQIRSDWNFSNLDSTARVEKIKNGIYSTSTIRSGVTDSDLSSSYHQPTAPLRGVAGINNTDDLNSTVSILSENLISNLPGSAIAMLRYMKSIVNVLSRLVLESKSFIVAVDNYDLTSKVSIKGLREDIGSSAIITEKEDNLLPSDAFLLNKHLMGISKLRIHSDLGGMAWIKGLTSTDLQSRASVISNREYYDIDSNVAIKYPDTSLRSKIMVNRNWKEDLYNTVIIRNTDRSVLPSMGDLKKILDLYSIANILHHTVMESYGILSQFGISEISSYATLSSENKFYRFPSTAHIKKRVHNYFTSKAQIETTARRWTPNLHAPDIFDYENRKLPRLWIRENFIKD